MGFYHGKASASNRVGAMLVENCQATCLVYILKTKDVYEPSRNRGAIDCTQVESQTLEQASDRNIGIARRYVCLILSISVELLSNLPSYFRRLSQSATSETSSSPAASPGPAAAGLYQYSVPYYEALSDGGVGTVSCQT